ncbi:MAG TPA: triose-phosphate isomerase [Acidimicrobiales bacterium]|nr:triose-phosphate isomerase [Acidimicrobiales bacterium]
MSAAKAGRKQLISGNWKMNLTHLEAIQLVQKLALRIGEGERLAADVSLHPPFTSLRTLQTLIDADRLSFLLGAQDVHWEPKGAFTGDISATMLAKLEVKYVIVGHSERRAGHGETDEIVNNKAKAVLAAGMTPIVCVGETLEQREAGEADSLVSSQVSGSLAGLSKDQVSGLVVAYEPVWAIGTGRTASPDDAQSMAAVIRGVVREGWAAAADAVRIQYGGSVNPVNAAELLALPDVDGALVGGASLDPDDFSRVVQASPT